MSRFEAGGLALIIKGADHDINVGKTVTLIEYLGDTKRLKDAWLVSAEGLLLTEIDTGKQWTGDKDSRVHIEKHRLIPLGDKQSQGELRKETMKYPYLDTNSYEWSRYEQI